MANGTITATPSEGIVTGTEITLTTTPASGYKLTENSLRAYKTGDENVAVAIVDGKMVMPAFNVTVTAQFEINTSIDTPTGITLALYPNPTSDYIYIKGLNTSTRVDIYSTTGTLVLSAQTESSQSISVSNLKTGVYLVKVNGQTLRLVKN